MKQNLYLVEKCGEYDIYRDYDAPSFARFSVVHNSYEGPGDRRTAVAATLEEAREEAHDLAGEL